VLLAVGPLKFGKIDVIFANHRFGLLHMSSRSHKGTVGKQEAVVHILGPDHIRRIIGNPPGHFQQCVIILISPASDRASCRSSLRGLQSVSIALLDSSCFRYHAITHLLDSAEPTAHSGDADKFKIHLGLKLLHPFKDLF
jgi:hypothetical protein